MSAYEYESPHKGWKVYSFGYGGKQYGLTVTPEENDSLKSMIHRKDNRPHEHERYIILPGEITPEIAIVILREKDYSFEDGRAYGRKQKRNEIAAALRED